MGGPLRGDLRHKAHLLFPFLADLVRHPAILDAIEDVLGPDILCWNTNFFIKEAANPAFVSWHQDSTYWGLSAPEVCDRLGGADPEQCRQRRDGGDPGQPHARPDPAPRHASTATTC